MIAHDVRSFHPGQVSLGIVSPDVTMAVRQRMAARCAVAPPESAFATPYMRRLAKWLGFGFGLGSGSGFGFGLGFGLGSGSGFGFGFGSG